MESLNSVASSYEADVRKIISWKEKEFARIEAELEEISKKMLATKKGTVEMEKLKKQFGFKEQEKTQILIEYNTRIIAVNTRIIEENEKLIALDEVKNKYRDEVNDAIYGNVNLISGGRSTFIHSGANGEIDDGDRTFAVRR